MLNAAELMMTSLEDYNEGEKYISAVKFFHIFIDIFLQLDSYLFAHNK